MSWENQMGFCSQCGAAITANDFITGRHDVVCKKQKSAIKE
jgi:hypothetical protein